MSEKSLFLPAFFADFERICIVGESTAAEVLCQRCIRQFASIVRIERHLTSDTLEKSGSIKTLVILCGLNTSLPSGFEEDTCFQILEETCNGFTSSQKDLINTDWQALRNIERELLKMHEAGLWTLPDETRQLMTDREACRDKVDEEINPYDSPS